MFKPKYQISEQLLQNIKKISLLVSELNQHSYPEPVLLEMERRAEAISTFASTSIEGNPLPLTEIKSLLKNRPQNLRDTEREVLNYNQALNQLKKEKSFISLDLILKTHKRITAGLLVKEKSGALRKEPVIVNDPRTGKTIFWPPDHGDLKKLLNSLIAYIKENKNSVDQVILSGIFHKQFVLIHPFIDGNGRCARLITKHLLANLGLNTLHLFSFENYYNKNVSNYFEQVGERGNYYELIEDLDFSAWLEYFSAGIIDELLRVKKDLEASSVSPETELQKHHHLIIDEIKSRGYITDKLYSKLTERAKATRSLDFRKLLDLQIIEKHGRGRTTHYKLHDS